MVRIKALSVHSRESSQGPLTINIFVNRPSIGFEDVQDAREPEVAQVVQLSEEDVRVGKRIPLRFVRFQSVNSVHVSLLHEASL
jgi:hypothetical protein